jgi:hypothetical protein
MHYMYQQNLTESPDGTECFKYIAKIKNKKDQQTFIISHGETNSRLSFVVEARIEPSTFRIVSLKFTYLAILPTW